jgi:uroporphyrinogen-III decarboxylase
MPDWASFDPSKYESRWQASRARLQAAHEFREGDCVPVLSSEYGSYWAWVLGIDIADYYEDLDTQIEVQMRGLTWHHENVPDDRTDCSIGFDCGPIGEAVVFDCDIERPRGTSPWILPRISSAEDVDRLEIVDPRHNPRVQALLERGREYKQRALDLGVKIPIGTGGLGIHPPLSAACALAGADWVYLNMLAEPALVLKLFEKCFRAFCLCQEYMYELHGGGPGGLGLADDNSSFVSD